MHELTKWKWGLSWLGFFVGVVVIHGGSVGMQNTTPLRVSPSTVPAGSTGVTITVVGSGFASGDTVRVNGNIVPTTFVSNTTLTAAIPDSLLANPGILNISASGYVNSAVPLIVFSTTRPQVSSFGGQRRFARNTQVIAYLSGSGLTGLITTISGSGVRAEVLSGATDTQLTLQITVDAVAPLGVRVVTFSTPAGTASECASINPCSIEVIDGGGWANAGQLNYPRTGASVTPLVDGRVLVAGGDDGAGGVTAEIYDPTENRWAITASMNGSHVGHTATLLPDGRVLLVGGQFNNPNAEVYDPSTGRWTVTGSLRQGGTTAYSVLLSNGTVLVGKREGIPEIYDPANGTWRSAGTAEARAVGPFVVLPDGRVFSSSGHNIFDPITETWSTVISNGLPTWAFLLPDGRIIEGGGMTINARAFRASVNSTSIYDLRQPGTSSSGAAGALTGTLLATGSLLQTAANGGPNGCCDNSAFLFDPEGGVVTVPPRTTLAGGFQLNSPPSVLLPDGRVLVIGRIDSSQSRGPVRVAEVYIPASYVNPVPALTSVTFDSPELAGRPGRRVFTGINFLPNTIVRIGTTKLVTIYLGAQKLLAFVPDSLRAALNSSSVTVTNPSPGGGTITTESVGIIPAPVISSLSPSAAMPGTTVVAVLTGSNLAGTTSVTFDGTGVTAAIQTGGSSTQLTLAITIAPRAALGPRTITVTTSAGTHTARGLFSIELPARNTPSTPPQPIAEVEQGDIRTGYIMVTPDSSSLPPTVTAVFGLVRGGLVQSQAAMLPTPMTNQASLPAESIRGIGRGTGVALANPGSTQNSISLTLLNESGVQIGTPVTVALQPQQQVAKFIDELFTREAIGSVFTGSVQVQSANAFSALGLRFSGNGFTTLPVAIGSTTFIGVPARTMVATAIADSPTAGTAGGNTSILFPQFAMGGGWATQLTLINPNQTGVSGRVDVFDANGNPMGVRLNGFTKSTFLYSIPAGGTLTLAPRDSNGQSPM